MGRTTIYNKITNEESIKKINPNNKQLCEDFLEYLASIDRAPSTINGYRNDLEIFFCYCMRHYLNTKLLKLNIPANVVQEFFGWSSSDMVNLYNDSEVSEEFSKYFTKDGIVEGKSSSLSDL